MLLVVGKCEGEITDFEILKLDPARAGGKLGLFNVVTTFYFWVSGPITLGIILELVKINKLKRPIFNIPVGEVEEISKLFSEFTPFT